MKCDFCEDPMKEDETGIMLINDGLGGHISCARAFLSSRENTPETREEFLKDVQGDES